MASAIAECAEVLKASDAVEVGAEICARDLFRIAYIDLKYRLGQIICIVWQPTSEEGEDLVVMALDQYVGRSLVAGEEASVELRVAWCFGRVFRR